MAFKLKISEPFVITQGPRYKDIGWGPYQEPSLGRADDGTVYAGVKMTEDSGKAYGAKNGTSFFRSSDGGESWSPVPVEEWDTVALLRAPKLKTGERVNVGMKKINVALVIAHFVTPFKKNSGHKKTPPLIIHAFGRFVNKSGVLFIFILKLAYFALITSITGLDIIPSSFTRCS